jgi:hypothetical protein
MLLYLKQAYSNLNLQYYFSLGNIRFPLFKAKVKTHVSHCCIRGASEVHEIQREVPTSETCVTECALQFGVASVASTITGGRLLG